MILGLGVWFPVIAAAAPELWLPGGGAEQIASEYAALNLAEDCGLTDEYIADPAALSDPLWVRACAWQYLLNEALPAYAWAPGQRIVQLSAPYFVRRGDAEEPRHHLAAADARSYGVVLERIAWAWLLASRSPPAGSPTEVGWYADRQYGPALRYWARGLIEIGPWRDLRPPTVAAPLDDLERTRLLIGLAVAYDAYADVLDAAERTAWEEVLAAEAADLEWEALVDDPLPASPFSRRRVLTNSHLWWRYAAIGIAGCVLRNRTDLALDAGRWRDEADSFFTEATARWDGSDPGGLYYGEHRWEALVRWLEATRLVEPDSTDLYGSWADDLPYFFRHFTLPNGQRASFGDGVPSDLDKPSWVFARLADERGANGTLAQRLAWLGHNRWTYAQNRRDVLDVAWWNADLAPMSAVEATQIPTHACFSGAGMVSLRSGWDAGAVHWVGRAGPLVGGHDDPDVGSFSLYGDGHLIGDDRANNVAKRTSLHSTLRIGGQGQHGNFRAFTVEPPDNTDGSVDENDGYRIAFLNGKGSAAGPRGPVPVDVVSYGVNLTQLYRYDAPGDDLHWLGGDVGWYSQVDGLVDARRWVIWLGGGVQLVNDRVVASPAVDVETLFRVVRTDAEDRVVRCPVAREGGLARYEDADGGTLGLQWYRYFDERSCDHPSEFPCIRCVPGTASCPDRPSLAEQLDDGEWTPVPRDVCVAPAAIAGAVVQVDPGNPQRRGRLQLTALDGTTWTARPATGPDGTEIEGQTLARATDRGTLLTALQPYTGAPPVPVTAVRISGGTRVEQPLPGNVTATVVVVDTGRSAATEGDRAAVTGDAAVVMWSGRAVLATQMLEGRRVAWKKSDLVRASSPASVAVTWGPDGPWGTVEAAQYPVDVWVNLLGKAPSRADVTAADGAVVPSAPSVVGGGVTVRIAGPSTFRVWTSAVRPVGPEAVCFGAGRGVR